MELEKVRDVYVFVCAALGTFALILTVYQAAHGKITSSAALGAAFVVCGLFVFIPQLKAFKVWGVEAELKETIDRAEEILGKLRQLSLISAKASYMSSAWSNRIGSPSAKDTQTILDEVDQQLADLNVWKAEREAITEPFVQVIRFDLYQIFAKVIQGYAAPKYSALIARANASQKPEDRESRDEHSTRITAWAKRVQNPDLFERSKTYNLREELDRAMPNENEWMSESERKIADKFKNHVLDLFEGCRKKGGYTSETAALMDRFPGEREQFVQELFGEELKKIK